MKKKLAGSLLTIALASCYAAHAADVTDAMIAAKSPNEVLSVRMGLEGQQYSPLKDLNTKNVGKLVPAWSMSFGGEKQRGQESQPLIHNGKMFFFSVLEIFHLCQQHAGIADQHASRLHD